MHDDHTLVFSVHRPPPRRRRWKTGYTWSWPILLDVWHVEPHGRDSSPPCRSEHWRWHAHHWRPVFWPLQSLRFALQRCARCGRRFGYGGLKSRRGYESSDRSWHSECIQLDMAEGRVARLGELAVVLVRVMAREREEPVRSIVDRLSGIEELPWATRQELLQLVADAEQTAEMRAASARSG